MDLEDRRSLATLLRRAAAQTISESEFWAQFDALSARVKEPEVGIARDTAVHYWGNFHARNILLIPVKPNRGQLEQGRNELNLIAEGLEAGWELEVLEERLNDI